MIGFAFLYLPILLLVVYSFNASRLVTVGRLLDAVVRCAVPQRGAHGGRLGDLRIALLSASLATVLGTLAAGAHPLWALSRPHALHRHGLCAHGDAEVITGLSLLLFFVAIGLDRGFWTITLAHTTLTMCFVTVVQSRLSTSTGRWKRPPWISARRRCAPSSP